MELLQCDQNYVSLKTSKDISRWDCPTLSKTWQEWVIERRGEYSQRKNASITTDAARRTSGSECLSWPSPVASEVRQGFQDRSKGMKGSQESLTTVVLKHGPPAQVNHSIHGSRPELWATPQARDWKEGSNPQPHGLQQIQLPQQAGTGKLNPRWVETLMGVPIGWTMPSCTSPVTIAQTNCGSSETE
jgi:hypothetical protein